MTVIEKAIIGAIVVITIALSTGAYVLFSAVSEAGGVRSLVIQAGKEVKDISKEIMKE